MTEWKGSDPLEATLVNTAPTAEDPERHVESVFADIAQIAFTEAGDARTALRRIRAVLDPGYVEPATTGANWERLCVGPGGVVTAPATVEGVLALACMGQPAVEVLAFVWLSHGGLVPRAF